MAQWKLLRLSDNTRKTNNVSVFKKMFDNYMKSGYIRVVGLTSRPDTAFEDEGNVMHAR
ncbi:hypothetical protein PCCS19_13280 [Paenibacillus sp. CCS19]|nr:hypothetical protein PCCS19_13280 [Paenibacillus cellulosilyticus]